jgi:tetratricopeptide (TPR) repeat protein
MSAGEILARDYTLNIRSCLRRGWALVRNDFWPLVGMSAFVLMVLSAAASFEVVLSSGNASGIRSGKTSILGLLLTGPLMGGLYLYFLKKIRGAAAGVEAAFTGFRQPFPHLVVAGFLASLLTALGFLCLILPGVYLFVAWIFTFPLIVDRRLDFWPAMQLSRKIISKHWWKFLGFLIVLALINLAGIATCCVGLFITFPITFAALAYAYEDITGAVKNPSGDSSPIPPIAPPTPPTPQPDRFWRRFAVVMACVVLIPLAIAIVGLLTAIAIPNFIKARQHSQQAAVQQWTQQGWQLWRDQKMDKAAAKFQQAVQLAPDDADAWNGLGWATFNSGKSQEAEKAFQKAISLDTNQPGALNGLGQIYLSQRKYDLAETYLLKAAPQAPAASYGLTRLYLLKGKFDQAESWAQKLIDSARRTSLRARCSRRHRRNI